MLKFIPLIIYRHQFPRTNIANKLLCLLLDDGFQKVVLRDKINYSVRYKFLIHVLKGFVLPKNTMRGLKISLNNVEKP